MPTYEYECKKCGKISEAFQSITDAPLKKCAKCGGRLKRLISIGGGIIFKGSGFYSTDYRSSGYKKRAQEDSKKSSAPCGTDAPCAASCSAKKTD